MSSGLIICSVRLECVSKREIRKFEWIFCQFKEEIRRLSSAKSRIDDAEMAEKTPKLRIKEFLRHTLVFNNIGTLETVFTRLKSTSLSSASGRLTVFKTFVQEFASLFLAQHAVLQQILREIQPILLQKLVLRDQYLRVIFGQIE